MWEVLLYSWLVDISGPDVQALKTGKVCQEQPLASLGSYGKAELPGSLQPVALRPTNSHQAHLLNVSGLWGDKKLPKQH